MPAVIRINPHPKVEMSIPVAGKAGPLGGAGGWTVFVVAVGGFVVVGIGGVSMSVSTVVVLSSAMGTVLGRTVVVVVVLLVLVVVEGEVGGLTQLSTEPSCFRSPLDPSDPSQTTFHVCGLVLSGLGTVPSIEGPNDLGNPCKRLPSM
ncbi:MAG TPA: hypothetical protein VIJ87_11230 [Pyrinomonadaceae bacterium]